MGEEAVESANWVSTTCSPSAGPLLHVRYGAPWVTSQQPSEVGQLSGQLQVRTTVFGWLNTHGLGTLT